MKNTNAPRMTLTCCKDYSIADVRRFLGLGPKTNPSRSAYPYLIGVRGLGYNGWDIIDQIKSREGKTEVKCVWRDNQTYRARAEITYC